LIVRKRFCNEVFKCLELEKTKPTYKRVQDKIENYMV
jgi:hypothetical protein